MEDEYKLSQLSGDYSVTFKPSVMVIVTIFLVLLLVALFYLLIQLYAKWLWSQIEDPTHLLVETRHPRHRIEFSAVHYLNSGRGLDPAILRSLPVLIFHSDNFKDGLECAVCLSQLAQGEKAKLLHGCFHGFHSDCIDMWFQSHSTCPLCRNPVTAATNSGGLPSESPNFPTNVLIWGNQDRITSAGARLEVENCPYQNPFPATSSSARASDLNVENWQ